MANMTERMGRIISGSMNAALEAIEDATPDIIMQQASREVEDAIAEVKAELGAVIADSYNATKKMSAINDKHEELSAQIEVALGKSREDLASAAIAKQMDLEAQLPVLEAAVEEASKTKQELEGFITALEGKLSEMRAEAKAFAQSASEREGASALDVNGDPNLLNKASAKMDKATRAFDRASGAMTASGGSDERQLSELKELAKSSEIEKRLAALKSAKQ